ncbi:WGR domain-containing protein [Inquilinus sp. OTU3971]|uniref:WGR domain-containing protein n=1 Tax=Inquilinus sp. OTU3971 TaxID=3043855 RepID=UPI00313E8D81
MTTVKKISMPHNGGTKEYHILSVVDETAGRGVVITRWGKAGAWGQCEAKNFENDDGFTLGSIVDDYFSQRMRDKETRGYKRPPRGVEELSYASLGDEALRKSLMGYERKIPEAMAWLYGGASDAATASPGAETDPVPENVDAATKSNPLWGTW